MKLIFWSAIILTWILQWCTKFWPSTWLDSQIQILFLYTDILQNILRGICWTQFIKPVKTSQFYKKLNVWINQFLIKLKIPKTLWHRNSYSNVEQDGDKVLSQQNLILQIPWRVAVVKFRFLPNCLTELNWNGILHYSNSMLCTMDEEMEAGHFLKCDVLLMK
jgi:hypothetical protein